MVVPGPGRFAPHDCEDCGETMVIEMSRMSGTTYSEDHFVDEVLPDLDIERIDHPSGEVHVYAKPENIGIKTNVGDE